MILDIFYELFVWEGSNSSDAEQEMALQVAKEYTAAANDGRPADIPITHVQANNEPLLFKCHFHGWSNDTSDFVDIYQVQKQEREFLYASQPDAPLVSELKAASMRRLMQ